jgi:hypothetical protein
VKKSDHDDSLFKMNKLLLKLIFEIKVNLKNVESLRREVMKWFRYLKKTNDNFVTDREFPEIKKIWGMKKKAKKRKQR